jgi:hypothetical protein
MNLLRFVLLRFYSCLHVGWYVYNRARHFHKEGIIVTQEEYERTMPSELEDRWARHLAAGTLSPERVEELRKADRWIYRMDVDPNEAEMDEWELMSRAAGCLTPERAAELLEEVRRSREEWDREY